MGLGAGVLAATAALAIGSPPGQGANITAYTRDAYRSPAATQALDRLHDDGIRRVAIVTTWYMTAPTDSAVAPDPRRTPGDAALAQLIREARARGLSVLLKPQVDVRDGSFRGEIQPQDPDAWFASYEEMISHYAALAESSGADALTVGVELRSLSDDITGFDAVIAAARRRFDGTLTYAANWDEAELVPFWSRLDAVGVDAYYPLARRPGATEAALVAAWKPIVARLGRLSRAADRPVMLTELGYAARPDAAVDPSGAGDSDGPLDTQAQETAYRAALAAWSGVSWLRGIYWWDWPIDRRDAAGDAFTPRGRPAEAVVRQAAAAGDDGGGWLAKIPWPLLIIVAIWAVVAVGFLAILRAADHGDPQDETDAEPGGGAAPLAQPPLPPTLRSRLPGLPRWSSLAAPRWPHEQEDPDDGDPRGEPAEAAAAAHRAALAAELEAGLDADDAAGAHEPPPDAPAAPVAVPAPDGAAPPAEVAPAGAPGPTLVASAPGAPAAAHAPPSAVPAAASLPRRPAPPQPPDRFTRRRRDPIAGLGTIDLDRLSALIRGALAVDVCAILMRAPDDPSSLIVAGESGVSLRGRRWPADAGVAGMVLSRVEPIAVSDYGGLRSRIGADQTARVGAAAAAPLMVHRALRGALSVGATDPDRHFGLRDLELLGVLAGLVSAALAHPGGPESEDSVRAQVEGLGAAMDAREPDARRRTAAVSAIATRVGDRLMPHDERTRAELVIASRLHDVGMLRVPRAPLLRGGPLGGDEGRLVAEHPAWGCDLLAEIPGLQGVAAIVRFHQERWDGSGYPYRLAGTRIPLASRILGAAEAWATMTIGRPHAPARTPEHAVEELRRAAGTQFDPDVIDVLATISPAMPRPLPRVRDDPRRRTS
jgi:HD-GYP domain-containing protein (c-di-GMP phosphodiesterase class II)